MCAFFKTVIKGSVAYVNGFSASVTDTFGQIVVQYLVNNLDLIISLFLQSVMDCFLRKHHFLLRIAVTLEISVTIVSNGRAKNCLSL